MCLIPSSVGSILSLMLTLRATSNGLLHTHTQHSTDRIRCPSPQRKDALDCTSTSCVMYLEVSLDGVAFTFQQMPFVVTRTALGPCALNLESVLESAFQSLCLCPRMLALVRTVVPVFIGTRI
jgi:hypothetical protein